MQFPLKKKNIYITNDSMSFLNIDYTKDTEIPIKEHVGAFGAKRKMHIHEGVDLYCLEGEPVYAIEDGNVVLIENFTGPKAGSDWWNDTNAVHIEGKCGVFVYGEIIEVDSIKVGKEIKEGDLIGYVKTVLKKDKGRPMSMLHLELYQHGSRMSVTWHPWQKEKPNFLQDPTSILISIIKDDENGYKE